LIVGKGVRKGEELKAPHYASTTATRDYITARDIIPNIKIYTIILSHSHNTKNKALANLLNYR
jgi:hypothetical protein